MPITTRGYEDDDYLPLLNFARDVTRLHGPPVYATAGELDWWRCIDPTIDGIYRARLWLDGPQMVGFAYPTHGRVDMLVHPRYDFLIEPMLEWAEGDRLREAGPDSSFGAWCFTSDHARIAALESRNYTQQNAFFYYRRRPVRDPLPLVIMPIGYSVRAVDPSVDLSARVAVHRSAFDETSLTVSRYRRAVESASYRPDLDLVAVTPDGTFAAFCLIWYDEENRIGTFEPVGTHAAHRRKGLARAVMVEGLRRLAALGAETALVNTFYEDTPAVALYESLGFREIDRFYAWTKIVGSKPMLALG
jgi:ribosomal protein S18 acetylase RimI-like enzyme